MTLLDTLPGSLLEGFFPSGWDLAKIDACVGEPGSARDRQPHWHANFTPIRCETPEDFDVKMGHEIARTIQSAASDGVQLALILPVGPMGMYRWAVFFLTEWGVDCGHVHGFNMDEWSDADGNTLAPDAPGAFTEAMGQAFYGPLGDLAPRESQRNFATAEALPTFAGKIAAIKGGGGRLACVYGVGRVCHIAFWEPQFAGEYDSEVDWKAATHRIGATLHPLTVEQNAITSFKSRTTLVPAYANTIGPGLFLRSDYCIGGCDGVLGRGMQWQGLSFWTTLRHGPTPWIPSSYMPTLPGRLFYLPELEGPLEADCN